MKKFPSRLALILKVLATGSLSMLLSACYGAVVEVYRVMYGSPFRSGSVKALVAPDSPLPGIKVSYRQWTTAVKEPAGWTDLGFTDDQGTAAYNLDSAAAVNLKLLLEDVDGPANGGTFLPVEILVDEPEENVTLDPAP